MSADWFCKIGEKKFGPLNGQQLKTIVAKGQLRPEHLVRRGSEGPWVPAGRIKGLFPEGPAGNSQGKKPSPASGKPLPKAAAKPGTPSKTAGLPAAAEAPAPPAADIPQELRLGGQHKHHVEMNFDKLHIEATPVDVSRRKLRSGLKGLKKEERKKVTVVLWCFIGGGMTIGLIAIIWAIVSSKSSKPEEKTNLPAALTQPANSGDKKVAKDSADKKPSQEKEPANWTMVSLTVPVGNVEVTVLKPTRGALPPGAKTKESDDLLIVPVKLNLKPGEKKPVELKSWADKSFGKTLSLKDDHDKTRYDLLEQVAEKGSDGKTITKNWMKVYLVFDVPTGKEPKFLHLTLPTAAFQADGPLIGFEIDPKEIKSAETDKADKSTKSDAGDSGDNASKSDKK